MPLNHMPTDPYLPNPSVPKDQVVDKPRPANNTKDLNHHDTTKNQVTRHVLSRHSCRAFHADKPIPRPILEECLHLAQRAPSNSNIQPWRIYILEGAPLQRLGSALCAAVTANEPSTVVPIPQHFMHYRSSMGHKLYGPEGYDIPREQSDELAQARLRNYRFFDAPCAGIVCMDESLAAVDILSIGLYMQTLMFLLQERGISTCASVSVAGYPDVIRKQLGVPEHVQILSGLCIGYEDEEHKINGLRMDRDEFWKESVRFVDE